MRPYRALALEAAPDCHVLDRALVRRESEADPGPIDRQLQLADLLEVAADRAREKKWLVVDLQGAALRERGEVSIGV